MVPFKRLSTVSYSPSIVTVALFPRYSDILVENCNFPHFLHPSPLLGGPRRNIAISLLFGVKILEWCGYPTVKKV